MPPQCSIPVYLLFLPNIVALFKPFQSYGSDRSIFHNANNAQNRPHSRHGSLPELIAQSTPYFHCDLIKDKTGYKLQSSNASIQPLELAIRKPIPSNMYGYQTLDKQFKSPFQPYRIASDTAAHNSDRYYPSGTRKTLPMRRVHYSPQQNEVSSLQGYNLQTSRATNNPHLLRQYLNMLKRRYHRQIMRRIIPEFNRKTPSISLYWNSQNVPKRFYHTTQKKQSTSQTYNTYHRRSNEFHRTHSGYRTWPRQRTTPKTRNFIPDVNTWHHIHPDRSKGIMRRQRINTHHFQRPIASPNLYTDNRDKRIKTPYRELYLQNAQRQTDGFRRVDKNHLKRIHTQKSKQPMRYPFQHVQLRRTQPRNPDTPPRSMPYRERYLKMLRDREVNSPRKLSNLHSRQNPPHISFIPFPTPKLRHGHTKSIKIYNRQIKPLGNIPRQFIHGHNKRYNNHFHPKSLRHNFGLQLKRNFEHERRPQYLLNRNSWPSKPFNLYKQERRVETQQLFRDLLKTIDWEMVLNNCWDYDGFSRRSISEWCQNIMAKLQQHTHRTTSNERYTDTTANLQLDMDTTINLQQPMVTTKNHQRPIVTTGTPRRWSNNFPQTTKPSPWRFPTLTTNTVTSRPNPWVTRETPGSVELTTMTSSFLLEVATDMIKDRKSDTKAPGVQEWLKERCGVTSSAYIIGGRSSRQGKWAWQVSLQIVTSSLPWHRCGGVLIHPRWVLTAAHCMEGPFYGDTSNWRVVLADNNLDVVSGDEVYRRITRIITHPGYVQTSNFPNDLALLELDSPVDVTSGQIQVACLPDVNFDLSPGTECWISGWGETRGSGGEEGRMNELSLSIMDTGQCRAMWDRVDIEVLDTQVCLGDGRTGACFGDSGGPLMCERQGRVFVAGVMSWLVRNCSGPNFPNVFTRLPSYLNWLDQQLSFYQAGWSS